MTNEKNTFGGLVELLKVVGTGGMWVLAGLAATFAYEDHHKYMTAKSRYVEGIVQAEAKETKIIDPDIYHFSIRTNNGTEYFEVYGDYDSTLVDSVIDNGLKLRIKLMGKDYESIRRSSTPTHPHWIDPEQIEEIDGEKLRY